MFGGGGGCYLIEAWGGELIQSSPSHVTQFRLERERERELISESPLLFMI